MFFAPEKYDVKLPRVNEELLKLEGKLDEKIAKVTLAKFLRHNLGIATKLISGVQLAPYQEITLRGFFNRNFSMCVWSRGGAKSFLASVYAFLQCLFEPETNILIAGPTFRTARFIFEYLEKIIKSPGAEILAQAFPLKSVRRNDLFEWKINGGSIKAIPLNGEKIRGFRANILLLDEFLLLPEEIVKSVLMPFLTVPQNVGKRMQIRKIEDDLIRRGLMEESGRMEFKNNTKMIVLSSASFTFEYLYRVYSEWLDKIYCEPGQERYREFDDSSELDEIMKNTKYFVSQMSYEALPSELIEKTVVQEARTSSSSDASFNREFRAQFTDGSASYFSAERMHNCTFHLNETPHIELVGDRNADYIIAIDPNFSASPTADFFSMSILKLHKESKTATLVHNYAKAGEKLEHHIHYFFFLLKNFNIKMGIIDNADGNFIDSACASKLFKENDLQYNLFDFDPMLDGRDYEDELRRVKKLYNPANNTIFFKQVFQVNFIRAANELLQTNIDRKKIFFASPLNGSDVFFSKYASEHGESLINLKHTGHTSIIDFIDTQDSNIYGTKKECALIEVKSNPQGSQTFDLPQALKRNPSPNRARKDRYTTLLLGNWLAKSYYDIMGTEAAKDQFTFMPFAIR